MQPVNNSVRPLRLLDADQVLYGRAEGFAWTPLSATSWLVNAHRLRMTHSACLSWVQLGARAFEGLTVDADEEVPFRGMSFSVCGLDPLLLGTSLPVLANFTFIAGTPNPKDSLGKILEKRHLLISS